MKKLKKKLINIFNILKNKDRFFTTKLVLFFMTFILFINLGYLTLIKGNYYRDISKNSRIREVEIVAPRGDIYDANKKILATNKVVYTASIMKDEFLLLNQKEKNENLEKLGRFLELDGSEFNPEYAISFNIITYKDEDDFFKEKENPTEKAIRIIKDNQLITDIIKGEFSEKTETGIYKYRIIDFAIKYLRDKGISIPIYSGGDKIEFLDEENNFLKENGYEKGQSVYSFLGNYLKDDEGFIRKILNHHLGRKISYDIITKNNFQENLVINDIGFLDKEKYLETKSFLSREYSGITRKSTAKSDFVNIVKEATLDQLLDNVTLQPDSEDAVVVPAKNAIKLLNKNNIKHDLVVKIDESDKNHPITKIGYKDDEERNISAKEKLKTLLIENNLLESFITSDEIKYIAQKINTENNIIPQISIKDWVYVHEKNINDIFEFYKVEREDGVEKLFKAIVKYYELEKHFKYDSYNIIKIFDIISKHGDLRYVPVNISYNISVNTFSKIEENFNDYTGIFVDSKSIRFYPYGGLASHTIGYIGKISTQSEIDEYLSNSGYSPNSLIGKIGIEESQEKQLRGINGYKRVLVDNRGNITEILEEVKPVPGKDVYTSIDLDIQMAAEKALKETIESLQGDNVFNSSLGDVNLISSNTKGQYKNASSGSIVVLNAKTGQVVAIANNPDINLNMFSTGISATDWKNLFPKDEKDYLAPRPLLNIALKSAIQPGSTFKLASSLAALKTGLDPDYSLKCKGFIDIGGGKQMADAIWNLYKGVHGYEAVREAIRDSCNFYFYNLALGLDNASINGTEYKLSLDSVLEAAKLLGLGEATGIDINIPSESIGVLPDKQIKKAAYRNLYIKFLENNARDYLLDNKISSEELEEKISVLTLWIDEEVIPTETEIIKRLKDMGFDTETILPGTKETFPAIIKYSYIAQSQWLLGDTLNVVIGQGQNQYTPLQMARYMSTIANGGYKNKVSVVDKVVNSMDNKVIYENTPFTEKIELEDYNYLEIIKEGTNMASKEGSNDTILGELPFELGIKSGTAQVGFSNPITGEDYDDYGWMIGFAPYDNPQYVIVAVITQAGTSTNITPIVRDVFHTALAENYSN